MSRCGQVRTGQDKINSGQARSFHIKSSQVRTRSAPVRCGQLKSGQVRTWLDWVRLSQVYVRIGLVSRVKVGNVMKDTGQVVSRQDK